MILELVRNRYKPSLGSREWIRYWGKRIFLLRDLIKQVRSTRRYVRQCGAFGRRTMISPANIKGNLEFLRVGDNCAIGRVEIQLHAQVTIGNCVVINDGCRLLTGTHNIHSPIWDLIAKPIHVEDYAWIATGAMLMPGVTIGKGAVVGAGAIVTRSIEPFEVVAGNPARSIGSRQCRELQYHPNEAIALFEAWLGPAQRPRRRS
jgi:maltose O-acetyltransferase